MKWGSSPRRYCPSSYQIYIRPFCRADARCKCAPSIAGLQPCCAVRRWRFCSRWNCRPTTSCSKTTRRPKPWSGGAFMPRCCGPSQFKSTAPSAVVVRPMNHPHPPCKPITKRWCLTTAARRPTKPCKPRSTSAPSLPWPMRKGWCCARCCPLPCNFPSLPVWLRPMIFCAPTRCAGRACWRRQRPWAAPAPRPFLRKAQS